MAPWFLAALSVIAGCDRGDDHCRNARDARDWATMAARCAAGSPAQRLGAAGVALRGPDRAAAVATADALLDTEHGADAAYLAGYARGQSRDPAEAARGRALLARALAQYQAEGRHAAAADAAGFLARTPRPDHALSDALWYGRLALTEARRAGKPRAVGRAATALAEVYDAIGLADDARDMFFLAEQALVAEPVDLAFAYLKHGLFLQDLGDAPAQQAALDYLVAARDQAQTTLPPDDARRRAVEFAVQLNRASGLAQLGRLADAEAELALAAVDPEEVRGEALVRGYIAARRGDLSAAERLFAEVDIGPKELDYRRTIALELAHAYRRSGDLVAAERALRTAIDATEALRATGDAELRPWVLAHRVEPYVALIAQYATQGRGLDALVVAESLHARTWLDVVVAQGSAPLATAEQSLVAARLRQRPDAWPALDGATLLARLGDREALVLLAVDGATWRVDVRDRQVTITPLTAAELAAVARFAAAPDDVDASAAAGAALLPPDAATRAAPLYVVAGGPLAGLPFAALRVGGHFLVEARPVLRLPGLAALGCRDGAWSDARVFVGDARGDLPRAHDEVRRLGGAAARVGAAANHDAIRGAARAALLHAAVHGRVTRGGGVLELADGPLTPAEVLDGRVAPHTAILTGCATAGSVDAEAWGGFPSAFLAAGSRYVIATARAVPDAAAAALSQAYYAQPDELAPPARLAAAQRALIATMPASVWAAFAVWGDAGCDR